MVATDAQVLHKAMGFAGSKLEGRTIRIPGTLEARVEYVDRAEGRKPRTDLPDADTH